MSKSSTAVLCRMGNPYVALIAVVGIIGAVCGVPAAGADDGARKPLFRADIQPLFEPKCLRCHNTKVRKAELDLSTHAAVLKGGESGPVVVPGKPEESPLYEMVHEGQMPADKKGRLTPEQVESIRVWIEGGARVEADSS